MSTSYQEWLDVVSDPSLASLSLDFYNNEKI